MSTEGRRRSRIVIALDAGDGRDLALELARHIALSSTPELLGLFVENVRLLEHARSRLAREVMLTGGERPLERNALERQLRAQSAEARRRFEAAAARLGLPHSFEVARGEVVAELVRSALEAEALIVSVAEKFRGTGAWFGAALRQLFEAPLPLVLLAREGWRSGRSIAVIVEDPAAAQTTLQTATRLAKYSGSPVTVLLTGAAAHAREQHRLRIASALRTSGIELGDVLALKEYNARSVVQAARACRARLVVLPSPVPRTEADLIDELLRRLPSALLLVRG